WRQDERPELHILLSNGLGTATGGGLSWIFTAVDGAMLGQGKLPVSALPAGEVIELATIFPALPQHRLTTPAECRLAVEIEMNLEEGGRAVVRNEWTLWAVPRARLGRTPVIESRLAER